MIKSSARSVESNPILVRTRGLSRFTYQPRSSSLSLRTNQLACEASVLPILADHALTRRGECQRLAC